MGVKRANSSLCCVLLLGLWACVHGLLSPSGVNIEGKSGHMLQQVLHHVHLFFNMWLQI